MALATTLQYTESNLVGTLNASITSTANSATVTFRDRITGEQRTPSSDTKLFVIDKGTPTNPNENYEIVLAGSHSTTNGVTTLSSLVRGLAFSGVSLADAGNGKSHVANAEVGTVDVHYFINNIVKTLKGAGDTTIHLTFADIATRDSDISSPTEGMVVYTSDYDVFWSYQASGWRPFPGSAFADDTARDTAIPSPANGMMIYNTGSGVMQQYIGGSWTNMATGTTFVNASTTVAGKVEEATTSEVGASTQTGGTGARLFINPGSVVKTSSGAGDENKLAALDSSGKFAEGFIPLKEANDESYTASEDITAGDPVQIDGNDSIGTAFGTPTEVNGDTQTLLGGAVSVYTKCTEVSENTFVLVYRDATATQAEAVVAQWSGSAWSYGTPVALEASDVSSNFNITKISSNKFVVGFVDNGSAEVFSRVGTVNTSTLAITFGTVESHRATALMSFVDVCALDSDKYAIIYAEGTNSKTYMRVCTVSGTTITEGAETEVAAVNATNSLINITQTGTDKGITAYYNTGTVYFRAFTVSSTTPTLGTETSISLSVTDARYQFDMDAPYVADGTEDQFMIAYGVSGTKARYCTISGTTITINAEASIDAVSGTTNNFNFTCTSVGSGCAVITVKTGSGASGKDVFQVRTSGTTPEKVGTDGLITASVANGGDCFTYTSIGQLFHVYDVSSTDLGVNFIEITKDPAMIGFANEDIASAASGTVITFGKTAQFSGLTAGTLYYLGLCGTLSSQGINKVGIGVNTTTLHTNISL